ncbi:MAG: hypothetical protein QM477_02935 [Planctomycetota bacterium]
MRGWPTSLWRTAVSDFTWLGFPQRMGLLLGVGLQTRVKDLVHAGIPSAL